MKIKNVERFLTIKLNNKDIHQLKNILKEHIDLKERCLTNRAGFPYSKDEGYLRANKTAKELLNLLEKSEKKFDFLKIN